MEKVVRILRQVRYTGISNYRLATSLVALLGIFTILSLLSSTHTTEELFLTSFPSHAESSGNFVETIASDTDTEINNYGDHDNLLLKKSRFSDVKQEDLKTILMWNDAYGVRQYDIGWGREPFVKFKCPDTRCYATANRSYLPVEDFDAVLIHQRGIDWKDMPKKRRAHQRWIHWNMESAQYLYMDIHKLDHMFNWTMTYKMTSDFPLPYGQVHKIKDHPSGDELKAYIKKFGEENRYLAAGTVNKTLNQAAWFVSHCSTQAKRERYARELKKHMPVHIYGKCGTYECPRGVNETACYKMMEQNYRFYLSFENSICDDYVTEKYFNILRYNVIPITFGGGNFSGATPPHSSINAMDFKTPGLLAKYLETLAEDDARFAEYFWWKEFYEVRNRPEDRAQPYCDLCAKLNNPQEPTKVYDDMFKWWVTDSHCKRLRYRYS